ncbi:MAG: hypothetical protein QGI09_00195 [Dehalococcoidia bacterium]|jgi:hypothetical protein|nr:hypothetical protein [Dehalococcoidia bacterium]|tara:strand:+ start:272 stop:589 length:318 start_codon:yes stop_codon:yes gene_type:complete
MIMLNEWGSYFIPRGNKLLAEAAERAGWTTQLPNPSGVRIEPRIRGLLDIAMQIDDIIDYGRSDSANEEEPWAPLTLARKMREAADRIVLLTQPPLPVEELHDSD